MADKGISVISHNGEDYNINDPNIAGEFYPNSNYAVGDHVTHEGKLYVFTAAHTGAWTGTDVTQVQIGAELHDYGAHAMVRYDVAQTLTDAQKTVARSNIAAANAELEDKIGTVPSGTTVENQIFAQGTQISTNASNIDALQRQVGTVPTGETVEGQITDLKSAIEAIKTIPHSVKMAMDTLFSKAAYADADAASSYATFHAWATANPVTSITAVFTQGSAVIYDIDGLDTLKQYLVVTATFLDGTTATVTYYTLSGTLTVGTSTITVSYGGKTDSFSVFVTGTVYDGTFSFADGTTVTILNDHVAVMIGSATDAKLINLSSLSSNTSDPTSIDNINNKSTTFMSIAAGETVTAMIKNCVSDNTGWNDPKGAQVDIAMNLRKQNDTTSILPSAPDVFPKEYTRQGGTHYDKKTNDTKTYTARTSVIAGCLFIFIGGNFPAGTTIDFDIAVSVS